MMTSAYEAKLVVDCKNKLGESCIWDDKRGLLLWLDRDPDNNTTNFWTLNPETNETTTHQLPEFAGCFALCQLPQLDTYLFAFRKGPMFYNISKQKTIGNRIFNFEQALYPNTKPNDGRVDRFGNFCFGGMMNPENDKNPQYISSIYRINYKNLSYNKLISNLSCNNSICYNLNGDIMFYCDSYSKDGVGTIYKIKYGENINDISTNNAQIFTKFDSNNKSMPDGSCIDSNDYLWNAQIGDGNVIRYDMNGNVDCTVYLPEPYPTCCCFGGKNLDILYITTFGMVTDEIKKEYNGTKQFGGLYAVKIPNIKGVKENRFGSSDETADALHVKKNNVINAIDKALLFLSQANAV